MRFEIQLEQRGDALRLIVLGELDLVTTPELERRLTEVEASAARTIVLDLDRLEFLDSTGLRALLEADTRSRANGSRLRLTHGSAPVQRLFRLVGADQRLSFVDPA